MSTIIIPSNLDYIPFNDMDLFHLRVCLTPENFTSFKNNPDLLNNIRLNFFTGSPASYPRFDSGSWPYKLHPCPEHNLIVPTNNPVFLNFETITDMRVEELKIRAEKYNKIYIFYGGGIDATVVLCAMLRNWDKHTLSKVNVVMNQNSIDENPNMYRDHIHGKFTTILSEDFYSRKYTLTNDAIYTGGMCADDIFGYDNLPIFDAARPGVYRKPWKDNVDILIDYFSLLSRNRADGIFAFETISNSMTKLNIEADTIFDFLSWVPFNWGYNVGVYSMSWAFGHVPAEIDSKKWIQENCFTFFNYKEYQYWFLGTIGSDVRMGRTANMYKYAAKKYIFDFNKDEDYFMTKTKIKSLLMNPDNYKMNRMYAIDTNYNFYYQSVPATPWPI